MNFINVFGGQSDPFNNNNNNNLPTTCVHAGDSDDPHGSVMPNIVLSTTFKQTTPGVPIGEFDYSRAGNPTRRQFEEAMATLERGKYGFAFASGMAAMTTVISMLKTGDEVICVDDVYGGSERLFIKVAAPRWGLKVKICSMEDPGGEMRKNLSPQTKMLWIESPTNPFLKIVDIRACVDVVKKYNKEILIVVDNTFASPVLQNPLDFGADLVLHSVTKYIGGHSDVLMGAVVTNDERLGQELAFLQKAMGAVPSPFDCFLAMRGMKTLEVRMQRQCENAAQIAAFLSKHPRVSKVYYPGLPSHPGHLVAKAQMRRFGAMISFELKAFDGLADKEILKTTVKLVQSCKVFTLAESLGGVESLIEVPSVMTHAGRANMPDSLIRLSIGIESVNDLIVDLENALKLAYLPGFNDI